MRLIFVRHGEPDYVKDCLTERGKLQAANTAVRLKNEGISEIYASSMGRAKETASYTSKMLELPVTILDFMHEIGWGCPSGDAVMREGHPWTLSNLFMAEENFASKLEKWREHPYFKENECVKYYDMIAGEIDSFLAQKGYERRDDRYFCTKKNDETIALFAHGGSGACALAHILNISLPYVLTAMTFGLCSASVIDFQGDANEYTVQRIELFNDEHHVDGADEKLYFER